MLWQPQETTLPSERPLSVLWKQITSPAVVQKKESKENTSEQPKAPENSREEKSSHMVQSNTLALYPIHQATVVESGKSVSVFCDGGSNSSYITRRAADKIKAKVVRKLTLYITTMGNVERPIAPGSTSLQ